MERASTTIHILSSIEDLAWLQLVDSDMNKKSTIYVNEFTQTASVSIDCKDDEYEYYSNKVFPIIPMHHSKLFIFKKFTDAAARYVVYMTGTNLGLDVDGDTVNVAIWVKTRDKLFPDDASVIKPFVAYTIRNRWRRIKMWFTNKL